MGCLLAYVLRLAYMLRLAYVLLIGGLVMKGDASKPQRILPAPRCQPISVEQCKDLPYNDTRFPNLVGDESEEDAENGFSTFDPLIKIRCSSQLKFFLCSIYFPMCTDKVPIAIGPCRPLCERVQMKCEPLLKEFGFPWPVSMNCSKFPPENNHDAMCMKGPASDEDVPVANEEPELEPNENSFTAVRCTQPSTVYMNRTAQCVPLCHSNHGFPNLVGDESEEDAENGFSTFDPLIKIRCSSQLKFFLCSIYFPMCTDKVPIAIGPCRPLCERVQMKCEPLLKEFGFPWPVSMNCSKFPPENNHDAMCMKGPASDEDVPVANEEPELEPNENSFTAVRCTQPSTVYMNRTAQCVPLCHSNHGYTKEDRECASTALFIMSLLCTALTSVCLLTLCTRRECLVALPELSLLFCSISFALSALVYLFSLLYREQISCMDYTSKSIFVVAGVQHIPCTTAAILLYYFGTTGRLWWFVLCCTWNKHTQRSQQNSDGLILRTHVLAWGVPLGVVMLALMAQSVHADPLSGMCLVGGANRVIEAVFVSLRELILLLCCLVPLFFGCLALIGSALANDHSVVSSGSALANDHSVVSSGMLGSVYPMAAAFLLLSSLQYVLSPAISGWNTVTAIKLLADPLLGVLASGGCLFQILYNMFNASRSPLVDKHGYQPALPHIPQPPLPTTTYSIGRHPEQRPLC
ncbi:Frizzled-4 [Toxocara canis]|uniref:Frizzled-4 n=1 Tax=Toxocara canis TaxID=6265 RepID=A0A0B2VAA4_TOXCA|nr:Frizzled-4 [Toxocara canis]